MKSHFKVERKTQGELCKAHPHTPECFEASIDSYLDDMRRDGWDLVAVTDGVWIFKAVAKSK